MTVLKPTKFYRHKDTGVIMQGEEWDEVDFHQGDLVELIWIEDDFEYGKGQFMDVLPGDNVE